MKLRPLLNGFIGVLLLVVPCVIAEDSSELARLKQGYETAYARAVNPIKQTYIKELNRLLERQTRSGNLTDVALIKAELEKITAKNDALDSESSIERFFVGRALETKSGTLFKLQRNGNGSKTSGTTTTAVSWKFVEPTVIEVAGAAEANGAVPKWYLRFVSAEEVYIGASKVNTDSPLAVKR